MLRKTVRCTPLTAEANPDTEFVFYFVPFSILYWEQELRTGKFESTMDAVEYAIGELLQYPNVKIYFYHNEEDIITNLDNYKDYSHYGKWINSYMTQAMALDKNRLTKTNYQQIMGDMRQFVTTYDYDSIFD